MEKKKAYQSHRGTGYKANQREIHAVDNHQTIAKLKKHLPYAPSRSYVIDNKK